MELHYMETCALAGTSSDATRKACQRRKVGMAAM